MDSQESGFSIVPAQDKQTENCVVIPAGARPTVFQIIGAAMDNGAVIDNCGEEAGDDQVCVQFPSHKQELLGQDQVLVRVQELLGDDRE